MATIREQELIHVIEDLQRQVNELREVVTQRTTTTTTTRPRQVLPEPERFSGQNREWDAWLVAIQAKLRVDGAAIGDESAQFYFVYSSLETRIQSLALPFVRNAEQQRKWDPTALLEFLKRTFDDPNKAKKAGQRLRDLRQGLSSLPSYLQRFEQTLYEANASSWPDDAKITTLIGGLNNETKRRLNNQLDPPTEYNAFVRTLRVLGDGYNAYNEPSRHNEQGRYNERSRDNGKSNAMEWEKTTIAATRTAPAVSREQRQRWRDEDKCVRCGSGRHWVSNCKYSPTTQSRSPSPERVTIGAIRIGHPQRTESPQRTKSPQRIKSPQRNVLSPQMKARVLAARAQRKARARQLGYASTDSDLDDGSDAPSYRELERQAMQ